jgi:WhiB family transcriptional regulator, redox-sensing transcriptional regulator
VTILDTTAPTELPDGGPVPWMARAACVGTVTRPDDDVFFAPSIEEAVGCAKAAAAEAGRREVLAVAICNRCPVQRECLRYAVATRQQHGVWGGRTPEQLHRLIAKAGDGAQRMRIDHGTRGRNGNRPALSECPAGHPYDAENTYVTSAGKRQCQTCRRARAAAQQRAAATRRIRCPYGHPYDAANTALDARGRRKCRACAQARAQAESRWIAGQQARRAARRGSS